MARASKSTRNAHQGAVRGLWDKPDLLNLIADVLLILGAAGLAWAAIVVAARQPYFTVKHLVLATPLQQTSQEQVQYMARKLLKGNFFTLSVDDMRQGFEKLPWVERAEVRRRWPFVVEVSLYERTPVARWREEQQSDVRLMSTRGEVFAANGFDQLPLLSGPEGASAAVLQRYTEFSKLASGVDRRVVALSLNSLQAWHVRLDDGLEIELGRDQLKSPVYERLGRFLAARAATEAQLGHALLSVDVRYPSGFAVKSLRRTQIQQG